ncbi:MAG: ABC transporter ATP-binding protein [Holophagales bacterium]|nr:ABC transporter ATP-binding protein [Holophagales bacterium]MYD23808.1 ABC transporter ATP-binding protein [Holophagales bacterium]MYI34785.1 ABC transporter ATP-binding protein [Holophagales bacterium]
MSYLAVEDLSISFGGIRAVDDVSFEVEEGEVFAIIGPNGAGKTTLFNLVSGIYFPDAGSVRFAGRDITSLPAHRIAPLGLARTFQNIELFEHATVLQNLLIGRHVHRRSTALSHLLFLPAVRREELEHRRRVEDVIDLLELAHYREQRIANLPYGVRKVVEVGRALCLEPKLLLLDEPTSGLNPEESEDMGFWIEDINRDLGVTVVMVAHDMGLVSRVAGRVLALNEGRVIAEGSAAEVQKNPAVVDAYLGAD